MKIFLAFTILLLSTNAYAYLDPGTGSILIQSAIAAIVSGFFAIKLYWIRIKSWFTSQSSSKKDSIDDTKDDVGEG